LIAVSFLFVMTTAYCDHGRTASGALAGRGTVAVDPRIIPMGSRLWIPGYGLARAKDTGGAIKGRRIDVWIPLCRDAVRWGRRRLLISRF
jgi:3D (Asp-Asp-Asp) domain-containing protein